MANDNREVLIRELVKSLKDALEAGSHLMTSRDHALAHEVLRKAEAVIAAPAPCAPGLTVDWQPFSDAMSAGFEYDSEYWVHTKDGEITRGRYEWRQGWNPHGFNTPIGRVTPYEITYVAPFVKEHLMPRPPK